MRHGQQRTIPMTNTPKAKLSALTGLRFVAALHVVLGHEAQWLFEDCAALVRSDPVSSIFGVNATQFVAELIGNLAFTGRSSVSLFFVLSGFILAYNYRDTLGKSVALPEFYRMRFARIYPVYLLAFLMVLPFVVARILTETELPGDATRRGLLNLILIQSWYPPDSLSWNAPAWSLSVEMFFYASFPFLLGPILSAPRRTALCCAVFFCVATQIGVGFGKVHTGEAAPDWYAFFSNFPLLRLSEFTLGIALIRLLPEGHPLPVGHVVAGHPLTLLLAGVACVLAVGWKSDGLGEVVRGVMLPLCFAWLIYCLALGPADRVLGCAPMTLLGEASYALYITHEALLPYFETIKRRVTGDPDLGKPLRLTFVLAAIAFSVLVLKWLETPARKGLVKWFSRTKTTLG